VHGASSSSSAPVYKAASSSALASSAASSSAPVHGASSSSSAPVYVAHASSSAPVYQAASSSAPVHGAASSSAKVYSAAQPSVTSAPANNYPASPASSAVTVVTTTYVDACETGVTTKTETITKTVCNKCEDSVTSVYVCNNCGPAVVTYTLTKPATPATNVPSVPTYVASVAKPAAETPVYSANTPVYSADKPAYTPVYGAANTPVYSATKPSSTPVYDMPKKQEVPGVSTTVAIVYMTPVPVAPSAVPYPSAAQNGTGAYPVKPSGTGVASKPSAYSPPAEFTGAASRVGAGAVGLIAVVAGLLVL
jgi:chitinase